MQADLELLLVLNAAAYASLAAGLVQSRRRANRLMYGTDAIFRYLQLALRKRFPDLPEGYTIREGLSRAKAQGMDLRWDGIERELAGYEAYRFGKSPRSQLPRPELGRLLKALRRSH